MSFEAKLEIDLNLLRQTDNWAYVMFELEKLLLLIHKQTINGELVTGIIDMPNFIVEEDNNDK